MFKTRLFIAASVLFSDAALANGNIDYLQIHGDTVHFSTAGEMVEVSPDCAAAESLDNWAFSLATDSGKSMYSMLITASAGKLPIEVVSANDCADVSDVERPLSVAISSFNNSSSNGSTGFYLYTGDGSTKLGKIVDVVTPTKFLFLPSNGYTNLEAYYFQRKTYAVGFSEENCSGNAATVDGPGHANLVFTHQYFNVGRFSRVAATSGNFQYKSKLTSQGECINGNGNYSWAYEIDSNYEHQLCGSQMCVFKNE